MLATLALIGAVLAWSLVPLFLKYFTGYIDSWTANGIRYPVSALFYLPLLIWLWKNGRIHRNLWKLALIPALINIAGQILWALAPYYLNPGLIGFLIRTSTLWGVLGSLLLFPDERGLIRSPLFWSGLTLTLGGFTAMTLGGGSLHTPASLLGIVIVLTCSLFWAGYHLSVRHYLSRISSPTAFAMVACITSACLLGFMFSMGEPRQALDLPASVLLMVIFSGIIGIAVSHVLFYYALKRLGVAISSIVNLGSAFLTALLSYFIFNERLSLVQWIGGIVIFMGGFSAVLAQRYLPSFKDG
jgi:drug/metabolite transporter (DMT)-like permease